MNAETEKQRQNDGVSGAAISSVEKELRENKHVFFQTVGFSMEPMLYQRKSTVVLKAPENTEAFSEGDVVLYHRADDRYVLHRIISRIEMNGYLFYVIRGDNCTYNEIVRPEQILGVMIGFFADEQNSYTAVDDQEYQKYVQKTLTRNMWLFRIRKIFERVLHRIGRYVRQKSSSKG